MLAPEGEHYNYSGCGNTFNCNHPRVRSFILDCLRYWVLEMHVDGFRFDLASIMTRAPSVWHRDADGDATTLHCAEPPPASAAAAATVAPVPARSPPASADAPPETPPEPLRGEQYALAASTFARRLAVQTGDRALQRISSCACAELCELLHGRLDTQRGGRADRDPAQ